MKEQARAFFASPFSSDFDWLRNAVAKSCRENDIKLIAIDESAVSGENLLNVIFKGINEADFAYVVLSGLNANVIYELGLLHGLSKPTVVLVDEQTSKNIPFDLMAFKYIKYIADPAKEHDISNEVAFNTRKLLDSLPATNVFQAPASYRNAGFTLSEDNDSTHVPSSHSLDQPSFFGYFYYRVDGSERILIQITSENKWNFSLFGDLPNQEPFDQFISRQIGTFLKKNANTSDAFFKSHFSRLEFQRIGKNVFVKARVEVPFEIDPGSFTPEYIWVRKIPLFWRKIVEPVDPDRSVRFHIYPEDEKKLSQMRLDRVHAEYDLSVLECVDILVFREADDGTYEFLMLHRRECPDPDKGWEYPKGGLEYHETVREGAIRELLEETGIESMGQFRFGGYLGVQTPKVNRKGKPYDTLRVHGLTYCYIGDPEDIHRYKESAEHDNYRWMPLLKAKKLIWIKEYDYGPRFFDLWSRQQRKIITSIARPISLAFELTEKCAHSCKYCHRRIAAEHAAHTDDIKALIDLLSDRGILRLTFTGGEPLEVGKEKLFQCIQHANRKRIHTCLSTTGVCGASSNEKLKRDDITRLEGFLDHLLLSVNCIDKVIARKMYKSITDWQEITQKAEELLTWTRMSRLRVEVCTVVTRANVEGIIEVGNWLFSRNSDIFWRIDEYYSNGVREDRMNGADSTMRSNFELSNTEFAKLKEDMQKQDFFKQLIDNKRIKFSTKESRSFAPDVMITPQGSFVTSSDNRYEIKGDKSLLESWQFKNRRPYAEYVDYCREWDWETQWDWETVTV